MIVKIEFDVDGKPPRKSQWAKKDAPLVIKYRKAALDAREIAKVHEVYTKAVKIKLIVYAPNILDIKYEESTNDDNNHFIGDLDNRLAGVCEYLQNAKAEDDTFKPDPNLWDENDPIHYKNSLIINDDSQIIEITAKKVEHDITRYHVEIVSCD